MFEENDNDDAKTVIVTSLLSTIAFILIFGCICVLWGPLFWRWFNCYSGKRLQRQVPRCASGSGSFSEKDHFILAFLIGFIFAIFLNINLNQLKNNQPNEVTHNSVNVPLIITNPASIQDKVVFITPTKFTLEQIPTLTKIAQSLYPVRNDVLWIIVSITNDQDLIRKKPPPTKTSERMLYLKVYHFFIKILLCNE